VCWLEVAYIGCQAYGASLHVLAVGWNSGCANPFATLAVVDPLCPVVRSTIELTSPAGES
jgi:hypothetical protein